MKILLVLLTLASGCGTAGMGGSANGHWTRLASLPDWEGFAGSFAGVSGGALDRSGRGRSAGFRPVLAQRGFG